MIEIFLRNRYFSVKVNGVLSSKRNIECGVPQGAVLSPTLFNLYINDLPSRTPSDLNKNDSEHTMLYADDLAYLLVFKDKAEAETRSQRYLDELEIWMNKSRLQLAPHKCSPIIFSWAKNFDLKELNLRTSWSSF